MAATRARLLMMAITATAYVVLFGLAYASGFRMDISGIPEVLLWGACFPLIGLICARRGMLRLQAATECFGYGFLLSPAIVLSTYLAIHTDMPLQDNALAAADTLLGFDWQRSILFVDRHPQIAAIFNFAYRTFSYQLMFWPFALSMLGHRERAYATLSAFALLCFASSFISIWTPAVGTYAHYAFDASGLSNLDTIYGFYFLDQFNAVRDNPDFVWTLAGSKGILTFPSVHAAVAVLCAWAAWDIRLLRYPAIALNIAMALSAVPSANHYLIDVVAGVAVAAVSILTVRTAIRAGGIAGLRLPASARIPAATPE